MHLILFHMIVFICVLYHTSAQQCSLSFELHKGHSNCLYEYFPENTMVVLDVVASQEMNLEIKDPLANMLYSTDEGMKVSKYAFTSSSTGYYEMCIDNVNNETMNIEFELKYGVSAKDYSSVAKAKDLQPIEVELQKILDKKKLMNHYVSMSNQHERSFEKMLDSISSKIVFYSMILMGSMVFIGIIETVYLRKFMERRKLI